MSPSTTELLERLAATPVLLVALDFDGTLAPLVDDPMSSRALPESKSAVERLAELPGTVVAFVSGRMLADLRVIAEHEDDSPIHLAASHGAEFWYPKAIRTPEDRTSAREEDSTGASALVSGRTPSTEHAPASPGRTAEQVREAAEAAVADIPGAWIERKAFGFALHTRMSRDEDAARATREIDSLMRERAPKWRRRTGQDILEFSTSHAGKDAAIAALRHATGATAVFFAGDDVTDEDALASLVEGDLGVRVGPGETSARVRVAHAEELAEVLSILAQMRAARRE